MLQNSKHMTSGGGRYNTLACDQGIRAPDRRFRSVRFRKPALMSYLAIRGESRTWRPAIEIQVCRDGRA